MPRVCRNPGEWYAGRGDFSSDVVCPRRHAIAKAIRERAVRIRKHLSHLQEVAFAPPPGFFWGGGGGAAHLFFTNPSGSVS